MKTSRIIVFGVIILIVLIGVSYPLWIPLFVDNVVDEAFPFETMTDEERSAFETLPEEQQAELVTMAQDNMEMAESVAREMIAGDKEMNEDMPEDMPAEPVVFAQGSFIEIDPVHKGEGTATIYTLPEGNSVLRFENFRATNGPDLHVLLAKAEDPRSRDELGEDYIDLGQLKGNVGNQNYDIPADVDLSEYNSIVIYCLPFHVVFSTATLAPAS